MILGGSIHRFPALGLLICLCASPLHPEDSIPLPEHPRPDLHRPAWRNLNGTWRFRFDPQGVGESQGWATAEDEAFPLRITVPFPWGSSLSGIPDEGDVGWYRRAIDIPSEWEGSRVFLVVGASDWTTTAWVDGTKVGSHRGGYTPFELELSPHVRAGGSHSLVLRVDDRPHPFKLEGKQGYGPARGIWQTLYLEARPATYLRRIHFVPDVDGGRVGVRGALSGPAPEGATLVLRFLTGGLPEVTHPVLAGQEALELSVPIPAARLWSPESPFLYDVRAELRAPGAPADEIHTYFGMRKVGVAPLPGHGHPYVTLNDRPLYLQMALDQAYHPDGFYTYPSDEFMRDEILRSIRIGLNAIRIHVKIDLPRKLYWADRLGLLVMADVPNSWGEPDDEMRRETETALRGMIDRDFNHPAIFSWVIFNETWGLFTRGEGREREYLPETQQWVESMFRLAKSLDATRLVEDNSPCNHDHVMTDLNTWHAYLPGYAWREHLDQVCRDTFEGSSWNMVEGRVQGRQPLLNSECGNVWGYEGSTGDVDWSWDYHIMMNEFRRHPKVCGWLYTEHHDVINEWNGYYRFDRSAKITGLGQLVPGMSLRDLHTPFYVAPGLDLCTKTAPGERVVVPLWGSFLSDSCPQRLFVRWELVGWDGLGRFETYDRGALPVPFRPWLSEELPSLEVVMPETRAVAILRLSLDDGTGGVLHRNFTTFFVDAAAPRDETTLLDGNPARILRIDPRSFENALWTLGHRDVLDGLKVNGTGAGFFEYRLPWPSGLDVDRVDSACFLAELGAKVLHGKDQKDAGTQEGDFMRGRGTHDPSLNPNSYPMTDTLRAPSMVRAKLAGVPVGSQVLEDDPADHRGVLSWFSQKRDRHLREAGSFGYLVRFDVSKAALRAAAAAGEIRIRLEVDDSLSGGLAIYGERFGRYPLDPTLVLMLSEADK